MRILLRISRAILGWPLIKDKLTNLFVHANWQRQADAAGKSNKTGAIYVPRRYLRCDASHSSNFDYALSSLSFSLLLCFLILSWSPSGSRWKSSPVAVPIKESKCRLADQILVADCVFTANLLNEKKESKRINDNINFSYRQNSCEHKINLVTKYKLQHFTLKHHLIMESSSENELTSINK